MNENNSSTNQVNNTQPAEPSHSALNRLCSYLLKQDLKNLTNRNIASYRNWHKEDFNSLEKVSKCTIKIENLFYCLLVIYKSLDTDLILNSSFCFLNKLIDEKPNIGGKGLPSHSMIENFKSIRTKAESNYVINPTVSSFNTQTTSQSINNQTLIIPDTQINNFETDQDNVSNHVNDPDVSINCLEEETKIANDKNLFQIKNWIRRILIKENNIQLLKSHKTNGTTPRQLFYDKFPTPFLNFDEDFVEDSNKKL